jgi:N-acetylneuraminic acid mutarotase
MSSKAKTIFISFLIIHFNLQSQSISLRSSNLIEASTNNSTLPDFESNTSFFSDNLELPISEGTKLEAFIPTTFIPNRNGGIKSTFSDLANDTKINALVVPFNEELMEPLPLFRINAGGSELTYNGELFSGDANFIGGKTFENTSATVSPLFQTERSASPPTFEYAFNVPNGDYEVVLHFAEIFFGATGGGSGGTGDRIFDVEGEGIKLLDDYDIYADVGAQTEVSKTFLISVADGELNLIFDAEGSDGVDQPKVAAIEILSFSEYPGILVDNIVDQNNIVGDQVLTLDVVASGGNPSADFTYAISGEPDGIFIDPTTGVIYGTISQAAVIGGPNNNGIHEVAVTVSKPNSVDAQEQFIWTITNISCVWNDLASSSLEKIEAQSAKVGDKLYVFAGFLSGLIISDATEIYDTVNDVWNTGAPMPIPVTHMGIAVVGTDIWVVSGFVGNHPGTATNLVQIYNTILDSWSSGPNLPVPRGSGATTFNNGKIHYFGGLLPDRVTDAGDHYVLDVNNQGFGWVAAATLPNPRNHLSAASVNGLAYAIGGQYGHDNGVQDQTFLDVYDPSTDAWTRLADLPSARSHFEPGTIVHNGKIIIVGGRQGESFFFDDVTEYNPINNQWSERCKLPEKLLAPAAKVFGDRLIVANGGVNGISGPSNSTRWITIEPIIEFPPLLLNPVVDQFNQVGEASSLVLFASGGDPNKNITYTINNQPLGIDIDPSNDQLLGNINPLALNGGTNNDGVHLVTVSATKPGSVDAMQQFNWSITDGSSNFWFDKNEDENYTARHECSFVQAGDKFYLLGGRENAQTLDIYDYTDDTWNSLVNSVPAEFNHFQATEYQGLIWVIGAFKNNDFPSEIPADYIWTFNPATQEWIQGPEIPSNRKRGSAGLVVYNDKFYILAGNTIGHDGGYVNWFDEYDPATGIWTELSDAPRPRDHFHAAVINGKLYAASGRLSGGSGGVFAPVIPEVDVYDFATETWSTLPSSQNIPTPRAAAIVANFENKLIVAGGESGASLNAFDITEIYDPTTQSWSVGEPLNFRRHGTQGIASGAGIYVAGGSPKRGGGNQKNMEFYGQDNPVGAASVVSSLAADTVVNFEIGETKTISMTNSIGNIGTLLKNITLTGPDANEFTIDSGNVPFKLIRANATHDIIISHIGNSFEKDATLTITYNNTDSLIIDLRVPFDGLIYNGTTWSPKAPNEITTSDNALIMSGEYIVSSDIEVNDLTVETGASLIIEAGNSLKTNVLGDINVNGNGFIELRSTATSYSSLIPQGAVVGNVIYKRHVNNNDIDATGSNDLIAPPLSGQAFNEFLINNSNIVSNSDNTLYLFGPFNKKIGAYDIYGASETATLNAGTGYRAASTDTGTFSFTGTVNTGPVRITISNSGPAFQEWNLIGNPYPSYLNLATFLTTNITAFGTNSAAIYGYDGDASDGWTVWNQATAASHPDYLITPGQGFFVASEASGGPINFLPAMRVKGQSDDFIEGRSASSLPGFLKLGLNQNEKTYYTDFYFNPNASRGLDKGYDAQIWGGNAPNFSLFSYLVEDNAGLPMVIQSLGETDYADVQIPLGINANVGEQISISISENTLPSTIDVYLEDLLLQTTVLLNTSDYVLTPSNALSTTGRFFLRFTDSALSSETSLFNRLHVFNDSQNQSIVISGLITEPSIAKLYDVQGRQVISSVLHLNTSSQNIKVNGLEKGIYIISIESASEKMTQKLIIR